MKMNLQPTVMPPQTKTKAQKQMTTTNNGMIMSHEQKNRDKS